MRAMRAPVVQGAQVNTALAEFLKSTVTLPSEEADVLQVGVNFLHRSFTMMHLFVFFLAAFDDAMPCFLSFLFSYYSSSSSSLFFSFFQSFINLSTDC
jgi:hypothetical protein